MAGSSGDTNLVRDRTWCLPRARDSISLGDAGVLWLRVNERELGFIGDKGEMKIGLSFTATKIPPPAGPGAVVGD